MNALRPSGSSHAVADSRLSATSRALRVLRQRLAQGEWRAGERLPSEPALSKDLGLSRASVRSALAHLENEGLVSRRHGSGTWVNSVRPLVRSLHLNAGSDALIRSRGGTPGIAEMTWRQIAAPVEVAERLLIEPGTPVVHLYRVRTSDGVPVIVEYDYFPASLLPEASVMLGSSLYSFLSNVCGVDVTFGIANLEPAQVGDELAPVFGVDAAQLCLIIRQVDYDANERAVSYSIEHHLASAFDFQLVRQGPIPAGTRAAGGSS